MNNGRRAATEGKNLGLLLWVCVGAIARTFYKTIISLGAGMLQHCHQLPSVVILVNVADWRVHEQPVGWLPLLPFPTRVPFSSVEPTPSLLHLASGLKASLHNRRCGPLPAVSSARSRSIAS